MKNPYLILLALFAWLLIGCDKPNPNPELIDPIYLDLQKWAEEAKKAIPEAKAGVADAQKELSQVKPQTGQIEYGKKRLREAADKLNRTEQVAMYMEIRAESRLKFARTEYMKAWKKKQPWPDKAEYASFKAAEEARNARPNWDVKARLKAAGVSTGEPKKEKKEGEAAGEKKEAPKKE